MYLAMEQLVELIDEPSLSIVKAVLEVDGDLFRTAFGSSNNHQDWPGGYWDHVVEVMNTAVVLYKSYSELRTLAFPLTEALVVLFFHDVEKPWRCVRDEKGELQIREDLREKAARSAFRDQKLAELGLSFNARQLNAMRYVEGEGDDYSPTQRMMWPLAAFCHICDVTSARLWPQYPRREYDGWKGAVRITDVGIQFPAYQTDCPNCGSSPRYHEVRNFDQMSRDGDVYCKLCGGYVRMFDAS